MIINDCFKVRSPVLTAVFLAGMSFGSEAFAQELVYLIDLDSKEAIQLQAPSPLSTTYNDLNDAGQVVGDFWVEGTIGTGHRRAFFTGPDGTGITYLEPRDGEYYESWGVGINNAGQVAGYAYFDLPGHFFPQMRAFITGPHGVGMRPLSTLEGETSESVWRPVSQGQGVNESGQVVGNSITADSEQHAFITGPDGMGMRDLGTLGGDRSEALGINGAGQVVGVSRTADGNFHAFITGPDGVGMRDLGTLGGSSISADGINDAGQVVGFSRTAEGGDHAFITGPNGEGLRDLGTLGGDESYAADINNAGQVVGGSDTAEYLSGFGHAFITGIDGEEMTDLNSLVDLPEGIFLVNAFAINNSDQVLASAVSIPVGPIPEPETYALMLAGLGLIGFMARCKKSEF